MQLIPLTGTITFPGPLLYLLFLHDATHTPHGDGNSIIWISDESKIDATHTPHGDGKHKALRLCVKAHGLRAFVLSEKIFPLSLKISFYLAIE